MQYFFTGEEHDIHVHAHGNSKGSTPYKRTRESTMKCKAANGDVFLRCVQAAPEPLCILATDYQLQELEKNCTNSHNFGVLSLDPMFDLGKF